jgi:antitoxin FitA
MATLTIRDVDDAIRDRLRVRAAEHGRSMEAEVRVILQEALNSPPPPDQLGSRIHQRFAGLKGVELELPVRADLPRAAPLR